MSLYNLMMGTNPLAGTWLEMLNLTPGDIERLRDAWLQDDASGLRVVVLSRCGGNNRGAHQEMYDRLEQHPCHLGNRDADFDSTYAFHEFKIPETHQQGVDALLSQARTEGVYDRIVDNRTFKQRCDDVLGALKQ